MNSGKLPSIACHQCQVVDQRDRGDLQIKRPDHATSDFEVLTDLCINIRAMIIVGQRNHTGNKLLDFRPPPDRVLIFFSAMHQLRPDDGAGDQFGSICQRKSIKQNDISIFKYLDPDIRIEQKAHHQIFAGGNGSSSGSATSSSDQAPIKCAISGTRSLISSNVGKTLSVSATDDKTSRTWDSSFCAASGFSRVSIRSNSTATALMDKPSHFPSTLSSHNL